MSTEPNTTPETPTPETPTTCDFCGEPKDDTVDIPTSGPTQLAICPACSEALVDRLRPDPGPIPPATYSHEPSAPVRVVYP